MLRGSFWFPFGLLTSAVAGAAPPGMLDVDYGALVSRADLVYRRAASTSEAGIPIGNGRTGSLVWTSPTMLRFQINRVDVYASSSYSQSFFRRDTDYCSGVGYVDVDFENYADEVFPTGHLSQRLSLYEGMASIEGSRVRAKIFAAHDADVLVIHVDDQRAASSPIRIRLRALRPPLVETGPHTAATQLSSAGDRAILKQEFTEAQYYNGSALAMGVVGRKARVRTLDPGETQRILQPGSGPFTLLIGSAATFDKNSDVVHSAVAGLEKLSAKRFENLASENRSWWRNYWAGSFIHLASPDGLADSVEINYTYFQYISNLKKFTDLQRVRLQTLNTVIADFERRIEKVRAEAASQGIGDEGLTSQDRCVLGDIQIRQVNSAILALRREADTKLVEIVKGLQQAARDAKTYGERHWDFWSVLRRAKTGAGDVAGIVEAMSLRASYAAVLENAGPLELAAWAQSAIDTGDSILADAVLRENASRKQDERPFSSAALLGKLQNTEYKQAQALLTEVIDIADQGGATYSGFMGRKDRQAFQRIQLGLKQMRRIAGVSEEGEIIAEDADEGTPEQGAL